MPELLELGRERASPRNVARASQLAQDHLEHAATEAVPLDRGVLARMLRIQELAVLDIDEAPPQHVRDGVERSVYACGVRARDKDGSTLVLEREASLCLLLVDREVAGGHQVAEARRDLRLLDDVEAPSRRALDERGDGGVAETRVERPFGRKADRGARTGSQRV